MMMSNTRKSISGAAVLAFLALFLLCAPSSVLAQNVGGGSISIQAEPEVPIAGSAVSGVAQFAGVFPDRVTLFFRPVGETAFTQVSAVAVSQSSFRAEFPSSMPRQGIEVYVEYIVEGSTLTFPASSPEFFPVRIPALSVRATSDQTLPARQYRMVSVPFILGTLTGLGVELGSDEPNDVFGDDFGDGADPARWRLLRVPDQGIEAEYVDYAENPSLFGPIREGRGYWLVTSRGGAFDIEGGVSTGVGFDGSDTFYQDVRVPLNGGWNQIGNPFLFPLDWSDVGGSDFVEPPVAFRGSYEVGQTVLRPWEGYFVYNAGEPVTLRFSVPTVPPLTAQAAVSEVLLEKAGDGSFVVELEASIAAHGMSDTVYLGLLGAAGAARGLDLRKPGAIDEGLRVVVSSPDGDLASSFAERAAMVWEVDVLETAGAAFDLRVTEFGDRPPGMEFVAVDLDDGQRLPILSGRILVPTSASALNARRLRMELVPLGSAQVVTTIGRPFPNPFASTLTVPVAAPQGESVRLEVYDLLGRSVRVVQDGPLAGSTVDLLWDGTDNQGHRAAPGAYLLRLTAGSASSVARVTLLR